MVTVRTQSRPPAVWAGIGLVTLALAAVPANLIDNSDFSRPLNEGWQTGSQDYAGYHVIDTLPDGGVMVSKSMCGFARLYQELALPSLDQVLTARVRFGATVNTPGYYSHGALVLQYLDAEGQVLGETRYSYTAGSSGIASTDNRHVVAVNKSGAWLDQSLTLRQELAKHLPGVVAGDVTALRVVLEAFASGTSAC